LVILSLERLGLTTSKAPAGIGEPPPEPNIVTGIILPIAEAANVQVAEVELTKRVGVVQVPLEELNVIVPT
jgi:hypothetical protein